MRLAITVDNMATRLYVDGVLMSLSNANDWTEVDTITIPADSHVVAVEGRDVGVSSSSLWYRRVISADRPCSGRFDERNHFVLLVFGETFQMQFVGYLRSMLWYFHWCSAPCSLLAALWLCLCESPVNGYDTIRYDTRCYLNVHSKAVIIYRTEPKTKKVEKKKN